MLGFRARSLRQLAMLQKLSSEIAVIGIDIAKNSFQIVDQITGAIVLRQKWSRGRLGLPTNQERTFVAKRSYTDFFKGVDIATLPLAGELSCNAGTVAVASPSGYYSRHCGCFITDDDSKPDSGI
jgi:hypothetical protein